MPAYPYSVLIIAAASDIAGIQSACGLTLVQPVYPLSESPPRTEWGKWMNTNATPSLDALVSSLQSSFPASTIIKYHKKSATDPQWPNIDPQAELATDRSGSGQHPPLTTVQ